MCVHFYILQYNDTNGTYNRTPAGYVIMIHFIFKQFLCPLNRTNLANSFCSCDQNTWWISPCLFNKKKVTLDIICAKSKDCPGNGTNLTFFFLWSHRRGMSLYISIHFKMRLINLNYIQSQSRQDRLLPLKNRATSDCRVNKASGS